MVIITRVGLPQSYQTGHAALRNDDTSGSEVFLLDGDPLTAGFPVVGRGRSRRTGSGFGIASRLACKKKVPTSGAPAPGLPRKSETVIAFKQSSEIVEIRDSKI
jgi:hypothetical protein